MKFRKKPVVIEAIQFLNDSSSYALMNWINEGQRAAGREFAHWLNYQIIVPTLEGQHIASPGDWIIRGVAGEHYPCKPDIFAATYEAVVPSNILAGGCSSIANSLAMMQEGSELVPANV